MEILEFKRPDSVPDVIEILEAALVSAREGTLISVGIIGLRKGGEWQTSFSSSENALLDAAMLMELAIRRMGFK